MENLTEIIQYYSRQHGDDMHYQYQYYEGENCPVYKRKAVSELKASTHVNAHIDFMGDIVDLKVGYMGQSISLVPNVEGDLKDKIALEIKKFDRINSSSVMNSESIKWATISGLSHRLIYTEDGLLRMKNIPGWQVVYDYDDDPMYASKAYYYFEEEDLVGKTTAQCWVYDKTNVTYYSSSEYTKAANEPVYMRRDHVYTQVGEPQPHNFKEVPIFPLINNDRWVGDCEQALELIDLYDEIISDTGAEIKSIRLAYLKIWGTLYTGKDEAGESIDINKWLKQTSAMNFGTKENGEKSGDAQFLEKNINDTAIENMLNRLRTHIFEVSGSIDLKELSDIQRAYAAKTSLLRLENNAATTERYMRSFLYKQIRLMAYWFTTYSAIAVTAEDIDIVFARTLPRDIQADAEALVTLASVLTLEDALKTLGYEDADKIAQRVKIEREDLGVN